MSKKISSCEKWKVLKYIPQCFNSLVIQNLTPYQSYTVRLEELMNNTLIERSVAANINGDISINDLEAGFFNCFTNKVLLSLYDDNGLLVEYQEGDIHYNGFCLSVVNTIINNDVIISY